MVKIPTFAPEMMAFMFKDIFVIMINQAACVMEPISSPALFFLIGALSKWDEININKKLNR